MKFIVFKLLLVVHYQMTGNAMLTRVFQSLRRLTLLSFPYFMHLSKSYFKNLFVSKQTIDYIDSQECVNLDKVILTSISSDRELNVLEKQVFIFYYYVYYIYILRTFKVSQTIYNNVALSSCIVCHSKQMRKYGRDLFFRQKDFF